MGGLNLLRFLLADTTASAPLSAAEVARLRRESLEPLDLRLRRAMDAAHLEAGEIERRDGAEVEIEQMQMQMQRGEMAPPEALAARRLDFTRLHVAVEVPRRVLEPCANYQPLT
eukprot:scaffold75397_cov44-Phaeocystis_antarctica.AAC.1